MENLNQVLPQEQPKLSQPLPSVVKKFPKPNFKNVIFTALLSFLVVCAGTLTGYFLAGAKSEGSSFTKVNSLLPTRQGGSKEQGVADEGVFKDSAQGVLEEGGIEGEGTHHLVRDGGPSQYVYLTSTVIDLQSFVGKKVEVFGESLAGKKAGWLMDVGKIKVLE